MADLTELTGAYSASWLPWIMIPLVFYILPFPVFAIIFLWIEREAETPAPTTDVPEQG
jgi:photosystem I subunit VIII